MEMFLLCSDDKESDVRMVADECLNKIIKVSSFFFYPLKAMLFKMYLMVGCFLKSCLHEIKPKYFSIGIDGFQLAPIAA